MDESIDNDHDIFELSKNVNQDKNNGTQKIEPKRFCIKFLCHVLLDIIIFITLSYIYNQYNYQLLKKEDNI